MRCHRRLDTGRRRGEVSYLSSFSATMTMITRLAGSLYVHTRPKISRERIYPFRIGLFFQLQKITALNYSYHEFKFKSNQSTSHFCNHFRWDGTNIFRSHFPTNPNIWLKPFWLQPFFVNTSFVLSCAVPKGLMQFIGGRRSLNEAREAGRSAIYHFVRRLRRRPPVRASQHCPQRHWRRWDPMNRLSKQLWWRRSIQRRESFRIRSTFHMKLQMLQHVLVGSKQLCNILAKTVPSL